ncbi:MAG: ATP-binding cassette domain-containing protein [Clostridiales Family XIII bacterium]|jgi:molybdate transport system ATP-binding protein|nr:ATP-binding cassette domain-containing protein [Clostridiales Family XIII bacterium]
MTLSVDIRKKLGKFTLDVRFETAGGILALLGASGSGKSMTLKCIAGIETPDEGRIELDGLTLFDSEKRVNLPTRERKVGYLFQHYALFPNMTALENVMAAVSGSKAEKRRIAEERLKSMYLLDSKDKYPAQISGGQQQRVALARMLVREPNIIMLDEPLSALDSYLKWQLEMELVDIFRGFDKPVVYVTHNRNEVYRVSDDVCVLENGASEPVVSTHELFLAPRTLAAALISGCKNFSRARRTGPRSVFAVDWGVELVTEAPVPGDVQYLGVRSHAIKAVGAELNRAGKPADAASGDPGNRGAANAPLPATNVLSCRVGKVVREMFSVIAMVRPEESEPASDFARIRVKMINDKWAALGEPVPPGRIHIRIDPAEILLLK